MQMPKAIGPLFEAEAKLAYGELNVVSISTGYEGTAVGSNLADRHPVPHACRRLPAPRNVSPARRRLPLAGMEDALQLLFAHSSEFAAHMKALEGEGGLGLGGGGGLGLGGGGKGGGLGLGG